ncbi:hypothetical protein BT93_B0838 [Corymbia citriodora subsp. variegata]|nr:hypothetical protein BT93_B0838 [Corymbia citriodora subsp. variegata]
MLDSVLNLDVMPYTDMIIAKYIWIGCSGINLPNKSGVGMVTIKYVEIPRPVEHPSELPKWNHYGSRMIK